MVWKEIEKDFFETIGEESLKELFFNYSPWEILKNLKTYLLDTLPEVPKLLIKNIPTTQDLFLTIEGEVIPFKELSKEERTFYFRGKEVRGALLMSGVYLKGRKFYFGEGVVVEPFSFLEEPAYFSENTQIRQAAYIRGSVYTGKGAVIGHTTELKNSLLLQGAKAAHFAYVGDSLLGREVNLGAGTKLANLKFIKKEIILEIKGEKINTGLKKMGALLGDRVQTGCNAVLQPGTLLGKDSLVYPAITAGPGFFPPKSKIKS